MHFAYIDPGTGSLFLQAVIGIFLGGAVIFRSFFGKAFGKVKSVVVRRPALDEEN